MRITQYALLLLLLISLIACEPEPKNVHIRVDTQATRTEITVKNLDSFDWTSVEIGAGLKTTGLFYSKKIGLLMKGQKETALLNEMDKSGERFNPYTQKATVYYVECQTPQGKAFWTGSTD